MAINYLQYNPTTSTHGKYIQSFISSLENVRGFWNTFQTFIDMCDGGDFSNAANTVAFQTAIGAPSTAVAQKFMQELDSLRQKLTVDTAVTAVKSDIDQVIAEMKI